MSLENPYAPPQAELAHTIDISGGLKLAGRFTRLAAAIVDAVIGMAIGFSLMYVFGAWDYLMRREEVPFGVLLTLSALGFVGFLLVHGYLLMKNGQTVGKKLAGIRIADLNGRVPEFSTLVVWRYLPISVVALIPVLGRFLPLLDVLFIFRDDRRCIHDLIAGTQVVTVGRRINPDDESARMSAQSLDWMSKDRQRFGGSSESTE